MRAKRYFYSDTDAAAGAVAGAASGDAAAAAALLLYAFITKLGALTLGQRVKRYLASCRANRGSRAGKLEQQNEGRNAKPARFVFRLVARAQSADRVYANQRTSERANQQTTKQQTKAHTNERTSNTKNMPKWLSGRSWDAPGTVRGS